MLNTLAANPLLTIFLIVALGAVLGAIPFGKIRFGAAGALFAGLFLSALAPELGNNMALIQGLGLALFVYTVGLSAGRTFFSGIRQYGSLMLGGCLAAIVAGAVTIGVGHLLNVPAALRTGIYTGALTAAPALDTASKITNSPQAAVGYAFGYPLAVIVAIIMVSLVVPRKWVGKNDSPALTGKGLSPLTVEVAKAMPVREIPGILEGKVRVSYLCRSQQMRVVSPGEDLIPGDQIVVVGVEEAVAKAVKSIGIVQDFHLQDYRSEVVFEPITVSNPDLFGASVAQLNMNALFGAVITRITRGDLDMLATDQSIIEPADMVHVVAPRKQLKAIKKYLGDSRAKASEIDALSVGLGLVLGILIGMISFPLPGGEFFSLGPAAGPLIAGMILGSLRRTGKIIWSIPNSANYTMRQLGLLFFLAGLGLNAGPDFARLALSATGVKAGILAILTVGVAGLFMVGYGYFLGFSAPRTGGAIAGMLGQPAVLESANSLVRDERIESAYTALFAIVMIVKILVVPLIFTL